MVMRQVVVILALLSVLTGCASQYSIDGNSSLACLDGKKLYLRIPNLTTGERKFVNLDSCEVVHGRFTFGGSVDTITLAEVCVGDDMLMPVVLEGGRLLLQVDAFGQTVQGGPLNDRLTDFLLLRARYDNELWELDRAARNLLYRGSPLDSVADSLDRRRAAVNEKVAELEDAFIDRNMDNPLGPGYFVLIAAQYGIPGIDPRLSRILDRAPQKFLRNAQVRNYLRRTGYKPCRDSLGPEGGMK